MQSKDEIEITLVPRSLVPALWMRAAFHMERGARVGALPVDEQFGRLMGGVDDLWLIVEGQKIIGAFVTTICSDAGKRFVGVSNLSGVGVRKWVAKMGDKMAEFAHYTGCDFVRCYGKRGWSRLLTNVSIIGQHENGHMIYERAAA